MTSIPLIIVTKSSTQFIFFHSNNSHFYIKDWNVAIFRGVKYIILVFLSCFLIHTIIIRTNLLKDIHLKFTERSEIILTIAKDRQGHTNKKTGQIVFLLFLTVFSFSLSFFVFTDSILSDGLFLYRILILFLPIIFYVISIFISS